MIPIVFSTDHNFIMPTGVAILSMLEKSSNENLDIFIFESDNVTEKDREVLSGIVRPFSSSIHFIPMENKFQSGYETRGITVPCYYRLQIPWMLPQYDKVIYCDGDVIFKDNVGSLYKTELGDALIAGCSISYYGGVNEARHYSDRIGVPATEYFNSGVLLFNTKLQRENNINEEYEKHLTRKYTFQDQDILNIVCKGRKRFFSARYNLSPVLTKAKIMKSDLPDSNKEDVMQSIDNPCIIHYSGNKPWKTFTNNWFDWWEVYRRSPFYDRQFELEVENSILHPIYPTKRLMAFYLRAKFPAMYRIISKWQNP